MTRLRLLLVCILLIVPAFSQSLAGFKIGMSRSEVCRYIEENSTSVKLQGTGKCLGADGVITVATLNLSMPSLRVIGIGFDRRQNVSGLWSQFPVSAFAEVKQLLLANFNKPDWEKQYAAGNGGATLDNQLCYWHRNKVDIYLEERSSTQDDLEVGWLAFNSGGDSGWDPPASFEEYTSSSRY